MEDCGPMLVSTFPASSYSVQYWSNVISMMIRPWVLISSTLLAGNATT